MDGSGTTDRVDRAALSRQWRQEGRYDEIAEFRQQVKEATKKAWKAAGRQWDRDELNEVAWQEAARAFPPRDTEGMPASDSQTEPAHPGRVTGLGDIPDDWPQLPANASLAAEIQWVQSSRIDVVEELPGGAVRVHLDRADRPAPSKSALGWLETSIRAYSKYCDIAAKATSQLEDEREHVRREKLQIQEIRDLLAEMVEEGDLD